MDNVIRLESPYYNTTSAGVLTHTDLSSLSVTGHTLQKLMLRGTMNINKGKFYVVSGQGAIQSEHDTKEIALTECRRYTEKYDSECFVLAPIATTRPKKDTITEEL